MNPFSLILPGLFEIIGKYLTNDADKAKAQAEITNHLLQNESAVIEASRDVVKAEVESDSVLAKNWRPVLMYLLMALLVWIIAVAPIFGLVPATKDSLSAVPDNLWNLLMVGMGGYIVGRSVEQVVKTMKK